MKEFFKRTLFGFIFVVLVVGSILLSPFAFCILMTVVVCIGCYEMSQLTPASKSNRLYTFFICFLGLLVYALIALIAVYVSSKYILFILLLFMLPFLFALYDKKNLVSELVASFWIPMFYIAVPSGIMICIHNKQFFDFVSGTECLLFILSLVWINDIFAYLVGVMIGKHRLFERISPKKSWEGTIGGFLFTVLAAGLYCHFRTLLPLYTALIMATLTVIFGSFGDLVESMIKRQAGVKDSGKLIPGHGGILDRFDATFFAVPFVFIYLITI